MPYLVSFISSVSVTFLAHHFAEKKVTNGWSKPVRLIIGKYQIHHSFFGALFILLGLTLTSGIIAVIMIGYGLGNIWQHKYTHNKVNEKGMVFITKLL